MSKVFAKLTKKIFQSESGFYHCYAMTVAGGNKTHAVFRGNDSPKSLKTVEYILTGEWVVHPKYGKQFEIEEYERSGKRDMNAYAERKLVCQAKKAIGD